MATGGLVPKDSWPAWRVSGLYRFLRPLLLLALLYSFLSPPRPAFAAGLLPPGKPGPDCSWQETSEEGEKPAEYVVESGDTLSAIAKHFGVTVASIVAANGIADANLIITGQRLLIPDAGDLPPAPAEASAGERPGVWERLTPDSRSAAEGSPYYRLTWVTYYGRPNVKVMGILGEHSLDDLVPLLRDQAAAYDEANGPELGVQPAFHLVYGMATKQEQEDESHLVYLPEDTVKEYRERAEEEGFGLLLDVQIGSLSPLDAIEKAFPYLEYPCVHLALDPEFRMSDPEQTVPGRPPGTISAAEINEVQRAMRDYMQEKSIGGQRILIVHQFLETMITEKENIEHLPEIALTITADGFGPPAPKTSKYNRFITADVQFAGFKLFYKWDEPLLSESQALGGERYESAKIIEVAPNLVIYQ